MSSQDRKHTQGVMAKVLAANWKANKVVLTNLSICLVTLLIQGVGESPQLLTDLLAWGRQAPTNQLPMLRVLKELPSEAFDERAANQDLRRHLQYVLTQQSEVLVDVVATFLNEGGSAELRIEALEVAKNWTANGLLPGFLVARKLLQPVMNYLVPYSQQQQQLSPAVVIPLVLEVVATCLVIPDMKEVPNSIAIMFEWMGTRMASWLMPLCTGLPPDVKTEKDAYGIGVEKSKTNLVKKLLSVLVDCIAEFIEEISLGTNVAGQPDPQLQASYVQIINALVVVLKDSRLSVSRKVVDSLYLFCSRVSGILHAQNNSWVWHVQDGKWFLGTLQNIFRHVVNNNTFRFETNDLTFLYSDKSCTSTYREEWQEYRQKDKTGELLIVVHDLLVQADMSQKRSGLWTIGFLCSDIEKAAMTLKSSDKKEQNLALRRLEACVWAFAELHRDSVIRTKATIQVLATVRLLCQIPYSAVLTTTSAMFISRYKDFLDAGTLEDVRSVVAFILNQCIAGGETDHTVRSWDFRLVLTRTLRDVATCQSNKVMEVLRSQGILPMAQFADARLKPPKMLMNDTKVDVEHYGIKFDLDAESEHATLALRLRGRLAQGFVQLAVEKPSSNSPGGLVAGGHNLVRWVVYPVLAQLEKWIASGNRAFLCGVSGELYVLHMAMLPLQSCCSLNSVPGETKGPAITLTQFPGVPPTDKLLLPELCSAIVGMTRAIYNKHMTSPNIVRHILRLYERVVGVCLRDVVSIPPAGKRFLADVVEMTSLLYANTPAGQDTAFLLLKRVTSALLGISPKDKGEAQQIPLRNLQDVPERMNFVYQIASGMCMIGEMCVNNFPKVNPRMKSVPMGGVAVARLRYYFEFLAHVIVVCPPIFYQGLHTQSKTLAPLLDRCFVVLSIVLLSADKRALIKSSLNVFHKLASENRQGFSSAVGHMFQEKLANLLPPLFWIIIKIMKGEVEDSNSKMSIVTQTAGVFTELTKNFHQVFVSSIGVAVSKMVGNTGEAAQSWVQRFSNCKDPGSFRAAIFEFVRQFYNNNNNNNNNNQSPGNFGGNNNSNNNNNNNNMSNRAM